MPAGLLVEFEHVVAHAAGAAAYNPAVPVTLLRLILSTLLVLAAGAGLPATAQQQPGAQPPSEPMDLPPAAIPPPRHEKLDSTLNRIVEAFEQSDLSTEAGEAAARSAPLHEDGSVAVTFFLEDESDVAALERYLRDNGGDPRNVGEDYVEAYVPVPLLEPASRQPGVRIVRAIVPPVPNPPGRYLSEGAAVHGQPAWRARGHTGRGVSIGVIDNGFQGISSLRGSEVPRAINARCYTSLGNFTSSLSACENSENHGRAVAEIIWDLAPDASIYIVSEPRSFGDLRSSVDWLIREGVQVINVSLTWTWDGPGDGTSPHASSPLNTVNRAVDGGIVWVNSAGNYNETTWTGPFRDADGDGFHEFAAGDELNNFRGDGDSVTIQLRGGGNAALTLCLYTAQPLDRVQCSEASSSNIDFSYTVAAGVRYGVAVHSNARPTWIQMQAWTSERLDHHTPGSIGNPAESRNQGLLAAGAAYWGTPRTIASYSSRGPLPGTTSVIKPDIVGASDVTTSIGSFGGTSAAAPHVAGLAALVRGRFPSWSPSSVTRYLQDNAEQRGSSNNNTWGHGFAKLPPPGPGLPDLVVQSPWVSDTTLTPGQTFTMSVVVRNTGAAMAELNLPSLQYYRSRDSTIDRRDTPERNPQAVGRLGAGASTTESIRLTAPIAADTYYYGACVSAGTESNAGNNCSAGVRATVSGAAPTCTVNLGTLHGASTIAGSWARSCPTGGFGDIWYFQDYLFSLSQASRVTMVLASASGPVISLWNRAGARLGGAHPVRSETSVGIVRSLTPDEYRIRTLPDGFGVTGTFTLRLVVSPGLFTDHPIHSGRTVVKAVHFTELRREIDALRVRHGLAAYRWLDPAIRRGATPVRTVHLTQLRAALHEVYDRLGRPRPPYSGGPIQPGTTPLRAVHVNELRRAVEALLR